MKQQKEPKPLTKREKRKGLIIIFAIIIFCLFANGLLDLLFPIK